jgi:hypothetical protein
MWGKSQKYRKGVVLLEEQSVIDFKVFGAVASRATTYLS